ncbi:hypothetical protein ApDm4_2400 [Acetobacter pomorum]|nr:hypothetical protein ApDm4_2400 [Acetobacter pomorum]
MPLAEKLTQLLVMYLMAVSSMMPKQTGKRISIQIDTVS